MEGIAEGIELEIDKIEKKFWEFINPIKKKLSEIWEPIKLTYDEWVKPALDGLKAQFEELTGSGIGGFGDAVVWVLKVLGTAFMVLLGAVLYVVNLIVAYWIFLWEQIKIGWFVIKGIFEIFMQFLEDLKTDWRTAVKNLIANLLEFAMQFKEKVDGAKGVFMDLYRTLVYWLTNLIMKFNDFAKKIFLYLYDAFNKIKSTATSIWNTVVSFITSKINSLISTIINIKNTLVNTFNQMKTNAINIVSGLVQGVKDKLNGLKSGFISLANTIVGSIKTPLNTIIDKINSFIYKARSLKVLDFQPFAGIPTLPRLATGGIVSEPTTALIGESGREAVLPLDRNTGWMEDLANMISQKGGSGEPIHLVVQVGDEKIAEHMIDYINDKSFRSQANLMTP